MEPPTTPTCGSVTTERQCSRSAVSGGQPAGAGSSPKYSPMVMRLRPDAASRTSAPRSSTSSTRPSTGPSISRDLGVRAEPVGADTPRAEYRFANPSSAQRLDQARKWLAYASRRSTTVISVRAACVDGVVLLRLRLRRVHRDVDAGSEHQRRVGVARRIGDREVETGREEVVDEQPVRPPEAQAGHRRDRLRHRASRREGVDVGKLPGLLVRVVRLDDQRAVQVAAVPDPRLVASGARARLLPGPDEGAFAWRRLRALASAASMTLPARSSATSSNCGGRRGGFSLSGMAFSIGELCRVGKAGYSPIHLPDAATRNRRRRFGANDPCQSMHHVRESAHWP